MHMEDNSCTSTTYLHASLLFRALLEHYHSLYSDFFYIIQWIENLVLSKDLYKEEL